MSVEQHEPIMREAVEDRIAEVNRMMKSQHAGAIELVGIPIVAT